MAIDFLLDTFRERVDEVDEYGLMDEDFINEINGLPMEQQDRYILVLEKKAKDLKIASRFKRWLKANLKEPITINSVPGQNTYKGFNTGRYQVSSQGIEYMGDNGFEHISTTPMLIHKRYLDEEADMEFVEVEIGNKTHVLPSRILAERSMIGELRNKSADVHSENAKEIVKYFAELGRLNNIETVDAYSTIGWHDESFIPYDDDCFYVYEKDELYKALTSTKGKIELSKESIVDCMTSTNFGRLMLASATIAPALQILNGTANFILFFWGGSGNGKTAAQMVACSLFGNPKTLFKGFNSTNNSIAELIAKYQSIPLIMDESQQQKEMKWDKLIYQLCSGISKGRLNRNSMLTESKHWRNCLIGTGEQPIIDNQTNAGALNRLYHLECTEKWKKARHYVTQAVDNYGFYGADIINYIRDNRTELNQGLNNRIEYYIDNCAVSEKTAIMMAQIFLGDVILQRVLGIELESLKDEVILDGVQKETDISNSERAWDIVTSTIVANYSRLAELNPHESWGRIDNENNRCYILKKILDEILLKNNHHFDSVKAEWASKGYLIRDRDGKYTQLKMFNNIRTRYVCLVLDEKDIRTMEEWVQTKQ